MSAVIVLTPIVISSWPVIVSAVMGAATSMGFSAQATAALHEEKRTRKRKVETEIGNSEVVSEGMTSGGKVVMSRGDLTVEFGSDERGRCTVCVTGEKHSEKELRRIGEEVAGRVVQQFTYHKLLSELKRRDYSVVDEEVLEDESVRLRVRL